MKNLKYLIMFLAGVAFTLLLTGHVPAALSFRTIPVDDELFGVLSVLALIVLAAFITATRSNGDESKFGKGAQFLRDFRASRTDHWLGGICGALGERTPVPSWVWRLGFAIAFLYYGSGLLAYFLLWIFVPADEGVSGTAGQSSRNPDAFTGFLHSLKRSSTDYWFGGGLAERTTVPAWVWRLVFATLLFCYGSGLLVYILLWIFLPRDEVKNHFTT